MKTKPAFYVGAHHYSFHSGKPALILGVVMFQYHGAWTPCFHVRYPDGVEDWCPVDDNQHYQIQEEDQ